MPFRRLLVLQLDSVPWSVLRPLLDGGSMPRLKALYERGCSGTLHSTIPPITPAAWATFMTGVSPGRHGILGFKGFDARESRYRLSDARRLQDRNIYRILSDAGLRVGVVMQPSAHPPFPVNGFLLTGFDSPGPGAPFAYPRELEAEVLRICPDHELNFNLHRTWKKEGAEPKDAIFASNLESAGAQVRRVGRLARELAARHPVDALFVYFQAPDVVFHKAWQWCLPPKDGKAHERRKRVVDFFGELDRVCGELLDGMPSDERLTLVLSDHGHQACAHAVFANLLLQEAGLLRLAGPKALVKDAWRRLSGFTRGIRRKGLGRPIDWDKTRAFMPYQACTGLVYVNLKGRQPFGSVPKAEYARVRDEVIAVMRKARLPEGAPVFEDVLSGDDYFKEKDSLDLPDVLLLQGPGVDIKRRLRAGPGIRRWNVRGNAGIHHPEGLYILDGNGVKGQRSLDARILDMAPTLLAAAGQAVPSFMEGRVVQECFERPLDARTREWAWGSAIAASSAYTPAQEAEVEKRLADLGYLD